MKINKELIIVISLLVLNTIYFAQAVKMPMPFEHGEPGPAFFPLVLSSILYVTCIFILVNSLRKKKISFINFKDPQIYRPLLLVLSTIAFILLFMLLGYWTSTFLFTFSLAFIFEYGRKYKLGGTILFCGILSLIITSAGWVFFEILFDLHLPERVF